MNTEHLIVTMPLRKEWKYLKRGENLAWRHEDEL